MGGRRARSIDEIVGTGRRISAHAGHLARALEGGDPGAVVESSAKIVAGSTKVDDILYYASKLIPFIRREVRSEKELTHEKRQKLARKAWSRIKRQEGLEDDPIVTRAIVSAAAKAIGKPKK